MFTRYTDFLSDNPPQFMHCPPPLENYIPEYNP